MHDQACPIPEAPTFNMPDSGEAEDCRNVVTASMTGLKALLTISSAAGSELLASLLTEVHATMARRRGGSNVR